ncbi:SpaA isopeptide-forming pilin-related protein [Paenibacillus oceani]|uniref:LPXTG cell wall anchor domain-containing protein n=1 Tax=Paenibacillus oceani TaxID=2772510 RepID=A0A927GYU7_9BACL|nr:SpaA isopeptide-forming pilin-related protein [Paenibacillus oceani]MBD2861558.1 LPXTG cell wall anchor domain-containing protein [Paenibacillus oceani]
MRRKVSVLTIALLLFAQTFTGLFNTAYAAAITDSILSKVILMDGQGKIIDATLDPDYRVTPASAVKLNYEWELENGHGYRSGDTFTFKIHDLFEVYNDATGDLMIAGNVKVGTFKLLESTREVTMTFNDEIQKRSNVKGTLTFDTWFSESTKTSESEVTISIPIKDNQTQDLTVLFQPNVTETIKKSGSPNRNKQTQWINWTIDVNKKLERISNAALIDELPPGLAKPANVEVYELIVKNNGTTVRGNKLNAADYTYDPNVAANKFAVNLGNIDSAYQIVFTTGFTDDKKSFVNKATLTGGTTEPLATSPTVTVDRGTLLEKKTSGYDSSTQSVSWEIDYNYSLNQIPAAQAVLVDQFDNMHVLDGQVEVYEVSFDSNGNAVVGDKLTSGYAVTPATATGKNGFELIFPSGASQAYKIKYKTKAAGNVYEDHTLSNSVTTGTTTKSATQSISQKFLDKGSSNPNYNDKTIDWTVRINEIGYTDVQNLVFTDTFPFGGLQLHGPIRVQRGSTTLTQGTDYTITQDPTTGFTITFLKPVTTEHRITYTTKFDNEWKPPHDNSFGISQGDHKDNFYNRGKLDWKVVENSTTVDKTKTITAPFIPDTFTKANGFKEGSYDAVTKELTWKIGINYNNRPITDAVVKDILGQGQKYVSGSLNVHHMTLSGTENGIVVGAEVNNSEYTFTEPNAANNNTLSVAFDKPPGKVINTPYYITFKTSLDGVKIDEKTISNTANLYENSSTPLTSFGTTVTIKHGGEFVSKTGALHSTNKVLMDWSLPINRGQSLVENATVKDEPSANQILVESSFKLYPTLVSSNGTVTKDLTKPLLVKDVDYTLYFATDDNGKQSFVLKFKNSNPNYAIKDAYILEYQTFINASGQVSVSNSVTFTGDQITKGEKTAIESETVRKTTGSGTGNGVTGTLIIKKTDLDTGAVLKDAQFKLERESNGKRILISQTENKTDADGLLKYEDLLFGTYILTETAAPRAYELDSTEKTIILDAATAGSAPYEFEVKNKRAIGDLIVKKVKEGTNTVLQGATFKLERVNSDSTRTTVSNSTYATGSNGLLKYADLPLGNYMLTEIIAPYGYVLDPKEHSIELTPDHVGTTGYEFKVENKARTTGSLVIKKVEDGTNAVLEGAQFKLEHKASNGTRTTVTHSTYTTDINGLLKYEDLALGTYILTETKPPAGYELNPTEREIVLTVANTEVTGYHEFEVKNKARTTGDLIIKKVDADTTTKVLQGAQFKLEHKASNGTRTTVTGATYTTDINGLLKYENLALGTYILTEIVAPYGYELDPTEREIVLDVANTEATGYNEYEVKNKVRTTGDLIIKKVDADNTSTVMQGAQFKLEHKASNGTRTSVTSATYATDINGLVKYEDLAFGTYILTETVAPYGYELDSTEREIVLTVANTETTGYHEFEVKNKARTTGDLIIKKVDADNTSTVLQGAQFKLEHKASNGTRTTVTGATYTTDINGLLKYEDLVFGTYILTEIVAPSGYELDPTEREIALTVANTETTGYQESEVKNKMQVILPKIGNFFIKKVDDLTGMPLQGAIFKLEQLTTVTGSTYGTGTTVTGSTYGKVIIGTYTTGQDGLLKFIDMPFGTYILTEITAPNGYVLDSKELTIILDAASAGTIGVIEVKNKKQGKLVDPVDPVDPEDPTDPVDPGKPVDPVDPGKPTDPTGPGKPTDPTDPGKPTDPTDPGKPTDPGTTTPEDSGNAGAGNNQGNGQTPTDPDPDNSGTSGNHSLIANSDDNKSNDVELSQLPKTGEDSRLPLQVAGLTLVAAGIAGLLYRRRVRGL